MAAASVGVVPKRSEGFGNEAFSTKTLEFMACGVPVIVSRTRIDHSLLQRRPREFLRGRQRHRPRARAAADIPPLGRTALEGGRGAGVRDPSQLAGAQP